MQNRYVVLSVVAGMVVALGGCSKSATSTSETPQRNGVLKLYLAEVPSDVQCVELEVMVSGGQIDVFNKRFDVTPGQSGVTLTASGLPEYVWLNLAEKTYDLPCNQVVFDTPVTWFSPNAVSIFLSGGTPGSVSITLRQAGNGSVGVTTGFETPPVPCGGWTAVQCV